MVLEAVKQNAGALEYASDELKESLPAYVKTSLQAHRDFAFVLHGARPQPAPAAEEPQAQVCHTQVPLQMIMHHGYYHGIVLKRLVADFAGVPFGHALALRRDAARNLSDNIDEEEDDDEDGNEDDEGEQNEDDDE